MQVLEIGRNQPCPCGSGKKYKKCCLAKDEARRPADLLFYQVRDAYDQLTARLFDCFEQTFGEVGMGLALGEFFGWPEELPEEEEFETHGPLFAAWLFFFWFLDLDEVEAEGLTIDAPRNRAVAEIFMESPDGRQLSPLEEKILAAGLGCPLSYFEVVRVNPAGGLDLRDILTGQTFSLQDSMLPDDLAKGDILYGQVLHFDDVAYLTAAAPALFPPGCKPEIIRLRDELAGDEGSVQAADLALFEIELRELYFDLLRLFRQPPTLVNHDGELLSMHTIRYQIDSPALAFECLHPLAATDTREEMIENATVSSDGTLEKVEFTWNREEHDHPQGWTNTILGRIEIDGNRLTVEVNSAERAERIRAEIESRLGSHAIHKGTSLQSPASLLRQAEEGRPAFSESDESIDLEAMPELREALAGMIATHWRNWIDTGIPALQGSTPREMVKTASGREAVEALLLDAERVGSEDEAMRQATQAALREIRQTLGLD